MPCCKEDSFLLLEQSVTVGSKDVDVLVAKIGEALQLSARRTQSSCKPQPPPPQQLRAAPYPLSTPRAPLGRLQQQQYRTLAAPPTMDQAASKSRSKQLPGRGWLRGARKQQRQQQPGEENDDPHRLLQELILSGNLIKEAVRRLQIAARSTAAINSSSSYSSGGSSGGESGRIPQQ